jgi:phage terminase Nu1 subunit (DNA packaging protein)
VNHFELRPVPDELLTRDELAKIMRSSVSTVDRMKADGMPFVPWGRRGVRFRLAEALAFAEQYERKAA